MSGIGAIFVFIIIVVSVVRSIASATGNDAGGKKKSSRRGRSLEEWNQLQAQRRGEQLQPTDALKQMHAQPPQAKRPPQTRIDASQMSMADRIELARQRARQQAGGRPTDDAAEALQRARARAEAEAQRNRAAQMQQNTEREQAARQRAELQRRHQAEARARAEQQAKAQRAQQEQAARRTATGQKRQGQPSRPAKRTKPSLMLNESIDRVHQGHTHQVATLHIAKRGKRAGIGIGQLNAMSLRKAIVLKELLDKPIALRNPQEDLLS